MWSSIETEIEDMFAQLATCGGPDDMRHGFHLHGALTVNRATKQTRERLTPEQTVANRKALEKKRRAYKTAKQLGYDRARCAA